MFPLSFGARTILPSRCARNGPLPLEERAFFKTLIRIDDRRIDGRIVFASRKRSLKKKKRKNNLIARNRQREREREKIN